MLNFPLDLTPLPDNDAIREINRSLLIAQGVSEDFVDEVVFLLTSYEDAANGCKVTNVIAALCLFFMKYSNYLQADPHNMQILIEVLTGLRDKNENI